MSVVNCKCRAGEGVISLRYPFHVNPHCPVHGGKELDKERRPSISSVGGYKRGQCPVCRKTAERQKTFRGPDAWEQLHIWENEPAVHKRCGDV